MFLELHFCGLLVSPSPPCATDAMVSTSVLAVLLLFGMKKKHEHDIYLVMLPPLYINILFIPKIISLSYKLQIRCFFLLNSSKFILYF